MDDPSPLDPERLAAALDALIALESLDALHARLGELQAALAGGGADADCASVGEAALTRRYLLAGLEQVAGSRTLERARHYLARLRRASGEVRTNGVNDLNLNRWKEYADVLTDSLWVFERRDSSGVHTAGYWGNFVPQIPNQLMRRYTRPGEWVLDPFSGGGTTLIEAQRLGRNGLGSELRPDIAERARQLVASEPNPRGVRAEVVVGDAATLDYPALLGERGGRSAQLVIMHPPYHDIIRFSDDARDLSNTPSVDSYLSSLARVVENVAPALDRGRYLALVIGDTYSRGEWTPLGFQAMSEVLRRGFALKSIVVKNFEETTAKRQRRELWRYRALVGGFYVFKHEYVFIFQRR